MGDAWIVSTARTAIGTAHRGTLADADPFDLATTVVGEAVRRSGIDAASFDDIVLSESRHGGGDIARYAAVEAGLEHVAGLAHNRHCAGGLAAVTTAAATVRAGMDRAVVAGASNRRRPPRGCGGGSWAPTPGTTGHRPATPRRPTPRARTCPSPSDGTPPCRHG